MKRYRWKILGLCETRWKDNGNHITDDGHQFFYIYTTIVVKPNTTETVLEL